VSEDPPAGAPVLTSEFNTNYEESNFESVRTESRYQSSGHSPGIMQRLAGLFGFGLHERLFSPPVGSALRHNIARHRARGRAARAVLYGYDFEPGSSKLNQHGYEQVQKMADWVTNSGVQVVVEYSPDSPDLAANRRQIVITHLRDLGIADASDYVMVGRPLAPGLKPIESQIIYQKLLGRLAGGGAQQTSGNAGSAGGSSGGGGTSGGGGGSSGGGGQSGTSPR